MEGSRVPACSAGSTPHPAACFPSLLGGLERVRGAATAWALLCLVDEVSPNPGSMILDGLSSQGGLG